MYRHIQLTGPTRVKAEERGERGERREESREREERRERGRPRDKEQFVYICMYL